MPVTDRVLARMRATALPALLGGGMADPVAELIGRAAMSEPANVDDLLASQIDYYRADAPKYDDWWSGTGKHDHGDRYRQSWESEIAALRAALTARAPLGDVLEFAGGTWKWTAELVPLADSVTVVDAAPEAVAVAQRKVRSEKVAWVIDDIFGHRPVPSLRHRLLLVLAEPRASRALRPVLGRASSAA